MAFYMIRLSLHLTVPADDDVDDLVLRPLARHHRRVLHSRQHVVVDLGLLGTLRLLGPMRQGNFKRGQVIIYIRNKMAGFAVCPSDFSARYRLPQAAAARGDLEKKFYTICRYTV